MDVIGPLSIHKVGDDLRHYSCSRRTTRPLCDSLMKVGEALRNILGEEQPQIYDICGEGNHEVGSTMVKHLLCLPTTSCHYIKVHH